MEWYWVLTIIFGGLIVLMLSGLPVAFCFFLINAVGVLVLWGGTAALEQLVYTTWNSVATFVYLPITMFILMGEFIFQSGMGTNAIDVVDKWLGRLPGRLGLVSVGAGTLFAALSGSSIPSCAILGETLMPDMDKRGYNRVLSMGAIMASGGLAMMIPPSSPAILFGSIAEVSVGKVLISGVVPGLIMATFYATYIVGRAWLQPNLAPPYEIKGTSVGQKLVDTVKYVLPLGFVMFMVTGLFFVGIAGPSEAAAMGVFGAVILTIVYRQLKWKLVKSSVLSAITTTVMILLILSAAKTFSSILAYTGAVQQLTVVATSLPLPPIMAIVGMMLILLVLGCFMSALPMMMITLPVFMPIIRTLGFDPVWFGLLFLLNAETGQLTPPFGTLLFTMKGVAPAGVTMGEVIRASYPYIIINLFILGLIMAFPILATWLPGMMFKPT